MNIRIVNTGTEPVTIPITPAQAQLEEILEHAGWGERLHTGFNFPSVLVAGERAIYPVKRFTSEQLQVIVALQEDGKIAAFAE